jgi:hypothetical protein
MKPPRLLKNNIPAKVLAFRDEIMRRTNDNKLAETVNQRDIQATGAIDSLRAGQTVLITAEHANALANLPAPQAIKQPFPVTVLQFMPACTQEQRIRTVGTHNAPIAAFIVRHLPAIAPTPVPPGLQHLVEGKTMAAEETIIAWSIYSDWWIEVDAFTPTGHVPKDHGQYPPDETKRRQAKWRWLTSMLHYMTNHSADLQPHDKEHRAIAPSTNKRNPPPAYYVCTVRPEAPRIRPIDSKPTDRHVTFQFDVIGHERTYKSGKRVWIKSHRRGLAHEYRPKVYLIQPEQP